jgi:hypothetical protein
MCFLWREVASNDSRRDTVNFINLSYFQPLANDPPLVIRRLWMVTESNKFRASP